MRNRFPVWHGPNFILVVLVLSEQRVGHGSVNRCPTSRELKETRYNSFVMGNKKRISEVLIAIISL